MKLFGSILLALTVATSAVAGERTERFTLERSKLYSDRLVIKDDRGRHKGTIERSKLYPDRYKIKTEERKRSKRR